MPTHPWRPMVELMASTLLGKGVAPCGVIFGYVQLNCNVDDKVASLKAGSGPCVRHFAGHQNNYIINKNKNKV